MLVLKNLLEQRKNDSRAGTFRLAVRLWSVVGSGHNIHTESATNREERLQNE